jgi:hypothetical protein
MPRFTVRALTGVLSALVLLSLGGTRPAFASWPHDPGNGNVPICTAANDQDNPVIISDGAGGSIIVWRDFRNGTTHEVYAQRVSPAGAPLWTANGVLVCTLSSDKQEPTLVPDAAGGAIVVWRDYRSGSNNDIYAQRLSAAGALLWSASGVPLCVMTGEQLSPTTTADGAGGAIVTWQDNRSGSSYDVYAQRVNAAGSTLWTANGVAVCTAPYDQVTPVIVSDGAGGAVITWVDGRLGSSVDLYAQRVSAAGTMLWTGSGVAVCATTGNQTGPAAVADGANGEIVAWVDDRGGITNIYAQRLNAAGTPQWAFNGLTVGAGPSTQATPTVDTDGSGGAIVSWDDARGSGDIYAQRLNASGTREWTVSGVVLCANTYGQLAPRIVADGLGGAIVAWEDERSNGGGFDVFAQRVNSSGATMWTTDGAAISVAENDQASPDLISDGNGGAIITWYDRRSGNSDIYAQRIESFGYLGNPEPVSNGVRDVPNDQGGEVKVSWTASYLDGASFNLIDSYWILRSAPPNIVAEARAQGARVTADLANEPTPDARTFLLLPDQATSYAWEYLASEPAFHVASYSYVAATTGDSVGGGNPRTAFMIMARANNGAQYWFSAPDSGYSVDNLPPVIPAPFTAAYSAGITHLHWGENHDVDLAGYRLYRGSSSAFVPAPGNLISAQPDTGFGDVGSAGSWYKLSAIDTHGNESPYARLGPNGTLDAPGAPVASLFLAPPTPSPTSAGTAFRFGLPRDGEVTLTLFDQQGRRVRELARGMMPAGEHRVMWDGRDEAGRSVPSGLYFAKLNHDGRSLVTRLIEIR